jgi:hypothetical protein
LLGACLLAGLICSVLQVIIVLSDDYEAAGRTLGRIESRLRLYQRLAHVFTLTDAQLIALGAVLAALVAVALLGTRLTLRRAVIRWKDAGAAAAFAAAFALLASRVVTEEAFADRVTLLERHAARIEYRYFSVVGRAADGLDVGLTAAVLAALKSDEQWRAIEAMLSSVARDMAQLPSAYPSLYVALSNSAAGQFPASPLISIPERIPPLSTLRSRTEPEVQLERFASRFADSGGEDISLLRAARSESLAAAVAATRAGWSEDSAAALEQDLAGAAPPDWSERRTLTWKLAQRVGAAMYQEAAPQERAMQDWSALPWRFVKLFLDQSLDDEARAKLAGLAHAQLNEWLAGRKDWASASSSYSEEVASELQNKVQVNRDQRRGIADPVIARAVAEYAAARACLYHDVRRYSIAASAERWQALERGWVNGVSRLPPDSRDTALNVLLRIRQLMSREGVPLSRLALLARVEDAWRGAEGPGSTEEASATFQNVAAAVIAAESLTLGSRRFADENRDALLLGMSRAAQRHFSAAAGRSLKPSEGYKIDEFLRTVFSDLSALTGAALQRLARGTDATHATLVLARVPKACSIEGNLSTGTLRNGRVEPASATHLSFPCW